MQSQDGATFKLADLHLLLEQSRNLYRAQVNESITQNPSNFTKIGPIDLSVANVNGLQLPSPMKAIIMKDATDTEVEVDLFLNSDSDNAKQNAYPLTLNEVINFDEAVGRSYIKWSAQAGKTATFYVAINAKITTGKQISVTAGGLLVSTGSTIATQSLATVTSTEAILVASSSTRTNCTIQNNGAVDIFVGSSGVTATTGIKLGIGQSMEYKNTAALYAITASTSNTAIAILLET